MVSVVRIFLIESFYDEKRDKFTLAYGWEDLSELLKSTCSRFTEIMLETTAISPNVESREMISNKCMERFENITGILADIIEDGMYYASEDWDNEVQNAKKMGLKNAPFPLSAVHCINE